MPQCSLLKKLQTTSKKAKSSFPKYAFIHAGLLPPTPKTSSSPQIDLRRAEGERKQGQKRKYCKKDWVFLRANSRGRPKDYQKIGQSACGIQRDPHKGVARAEGTLADAGKVRAAEKAGVVAVGGVAEAKGGDVEGAIPSAGAGEKGQGRQEVENSREYEQEKINAP